VVAAQFWAGRRVLVTGHTGFKGAWLTLWLQSLGAQVSGLSREVPTEPSLFALASVGDSISTEFGDICDGRTVREALARHRPELVFHLAAQAFVRRSYREPRETFATNLMGTAQVLDALREDPSPRVVIVVTSDKCYEQSTEAQPFVEGDPLGGSDPYSASKAAAEILTHAYRRSFFSDPAGLRVATVRAGNVIGGGDWGEDRLVPDLMRGALSGEAIPLRRPDAVRPWQHVLNPLAGYLRLAEALWQRPDAGGAWNFGPDPGDAQPVSWIVERLRELWPDRFDVREDPGPHPPESGHLMLDSGKARGRLGWRPVWDLADGLDRTVEWYKALAARHDVRTTTLAQIQAFTDAESS